VALQHLLALLREAKTAFLTFRMRRGPLIVLGREQCELAEPDLLARHFVHHFRKPEVSCRASADERALDVGRLQHSKPFRAE
jgi:hypothetical protein